MESHPAMLDRICTHVFSSWPPRRPCSSAVGTFYRWLTPPQIVHPEGYALNLRGKTTHTGQRETLPISNSEDSLLGRRTFAQHS